MHRTVPLLAAALSFAVAVPAMASGGLPLLSSIEAGPYSIALYNDSPTLVTGRNVLTLEIPAAADSARVQFELVASGGQSFPVRLRPVSVLGGGGSTANDMAGMADMPGMPANSAPDGHSAGGHSPAGTSESAAPGAAPHASAAEGTLLRGAVDLPTAGNWTARLSVVGPAGEAYTVETALNAEYGGPNRLYLLVTGSLMAAVVVFGTVMRRLHRSQAVAATGRMQ
jgi:hypothetical protein